MRTNIILDDRIVKEAMRLTEAKTKREVALTSMPISSRKRLSVTAARSARPHVPELVLDFAADLRRERFADGNRAFAVGRFNYRAAHERFNS